MTDPASRSDGSFYAEIGGTRTFEKIVATFYAGVADDPILRPLYPEEDLGPAAIRFQLFLEQYWGGPGTYSELRGHPRLRMRHQPFVIGEVERDRWLHHMGVGLDSVSLTAEQRQTFWAYLVMAAHAMVNAPQNASQ